MNLSRHKGFYSSALWPHPHGELGQPIICKSLIASSTGGEAISLPRSGLVNLWIDSFYWSLVLAGRPSHQCLPVFLLLSIQKIKQWNIVTMILTLENTKTKLPSSLTLQFCLGLSWQLTPTWNQSLFSCRSTHTLFRKDRRTQQWVDTPSGSSLEGSATNCLTQFPVIAKVP